MSRQIKPKLYDTQNTHTMEHKRTPGFLGIPFRISTSARRRSIAMKTRERDDGARLKMVMNLVSWLD